jgi:predicted nucleic acid-binding protein
MRGCFRTKGSTSMYVSNKLPIELHERASVSFWEAMILTSARSSGCHVLYSEDFNPGQSYDGVLVVNPFETEAEA